MHIETKTIWIAKGENNNIIFIHRMDPFNMFSCILHIALLILVIVPLRGNGEYIEESGITQSISHEYRNDCVTEAKTINIHHNMKEVQSSNIENGDYISWCAEIEEKVVLLAGNYNPFKCNIELPTTEPRFHAKSQFKVFESTQSMSQFSAMIYLYVLIFIISLDQIKSCKLPLIAILLISTSNIIEGKYIYVDQKKSWQEADTYCNTTYGTNLASIHNRDEMIEAQLLTKGYNNGVFTWIGLSRNSETGNDWSWSDASPYDYLGFDQWSVITNNEKCIHMYNRGDTYTC